MTIYFYLFIPLLFAATDSSSIRGRNNENDLVPFMSSRSDIEKREGGVKARGNEPFFLKLLPDSGMVETGGKDKKKKQPGKKRISTIKDIRKRQRIRRELQKPKELSHPLENPKRVNLTEKLQNLTNAISRGDILKALSTYSNKAEKRSNVEDPDVKDDQNNQETGKHTALNRNQPKHALSEQTPLVKMVYPSTPKSDRHPHKYTYRDLITDRERLEQKINYIKNMLNVNDSVVDDAVRVRRRSDSDRVANKMAKMFLTLSAVNGLHDRRKSKCEKDYDDDDDENRVQDVWEKERKESPSRKRSSSNEQRYKVKKWIEFMKNKRSSGKTCPCMASYGEERDVFPLEQKLPKGYFLMERRESSEESSETYRDPMYPPRDYNSRRRLSKTQDDQDSKLKGPPKNGKKKPDMGFTDLELYRSRAKQILRNAEEILDRIKEEEEKRLAVPNLFMSQLRELTSRIQGDPRSNENDLIRKLQKNLGWGPLARSEEGADGNQFMENVKSFILDPYEKAKALTDESTKRLSSYLLRNLGKIQEASEEQTQAKEGEDNLQLYFGRVPPKEAEKPLPDSLTKESEADPKDEEKTEAEKEETYKQKVEDIIKEQQKILDEYKMTQDSDEGRKEMEIVGDKEPETVREQQNSNLEDKVALQLKEHDTDRNQESREKEIESGDESEKVWKPDFVEDKTLLQSEGTTREEKGGDKGTTSGNMQTEENVQEEKFEEVMKAILEDSNDVPDDQDKVEMQKNNHGEDPNAQTEDELIQMEHDSENAGQEEVQEVVASSQKTSGEISVRDENDVVSSPHLTADYDFIDVGEKKKDGPSGLESTPIGKDSYVQALGEDTIQAKSSDETVLENQENLESKKSEAESGQNRSNGLSDPEGTETVALQEPVLENSMERTRSQKQEGSEVEDGPKQHPEYADLVKEVSQASAETSKIDTSDAFPVKSNEEMGETDETLKMEQLDDEDNESTADRTDRANEDGETLLKLASDIQDSEDVEEDPNGTLLRVNLDENSEELETQDSQERQSTEVNGETPLKALIFETPRQESSEETLLDEALKNVNRDEEVSLAAEKPAETDNQELTKSADEDNNDGTFLKEAKETQNSEEIPLLSSVNNDEDETVLREESFEGKDNSNEKNKESEEVSDETALKAVRNEGLEEDVETLMVESVNTEDGNDLENLEKQVSAKGNAESEETLQSEFVVDHESNQGSQEKKESSLEIIGKKTPEDSEITNEENEKLEEFIEHENDNSETLSGLDKELKEEATQTEDEIPLRAVLSQESPEEEDETLQAEKKSLDKQEKVEEETVLTVGDPKETSNEAEENDDADEATLRAEEIKTDNKNEETSREVQISGSQENLEERNYETEQQANTEDKTDEGQNSNETLKSALENKTQDNVENEEENETIKAANPEEEGPKFKEQYSDDNGDDESVKAVLEGHEEQDGDMETVKMENVQDTLDDEGSLESEHFVKEKQEDSGESVKATFDEESLKSVKLEENSKSDGVVREALENTESADDDETVQMGAGSEEEQSGKILEYEEVVENGELKEKETQTEDETPLRAVLSQENLEEDETLQTENSNGEEKQKESNNDESQLRNVGVEDELDNKIDDQGPLRSSMTETGAPDYHKSLNEEILREETLNNEIDEQDETLQSKSFDQSGKSFNEDVEQTFMEDSSSENAREGSDSTLTDVNPLPKAEVQETGSKFSDVLQMPEQSSKSVKGGTLKVPKSIGEIMNDLEGETKGDITSLQNLNPDKIDHIIVKIGEAEQKNLLGSQEADCVKECACAEEMNTRSRNIGRYEIVKDFLHWMKDLQLNRVLSDD